MSEKSNPPSTCSTSTDDIQTIIRNDDDNKRGIVSAYILAIPLGLFGAHHFYLRRPGWGCLYLFTLGLLGVGYVVDLFRMVVLVRRANKAYAERGNPTRIQQKYLDDAYVAWLPMGLFGAHHFYLRNIGWGFAYFFTFGFMGIGWLIDAICMYKMVAEFNAHELSKHTAPILGTTNLPAETLGCTKRPRRLTTAYRLWGFPFTGLLGAHHYYMGRVAFGLFYTFTLGGLGVGWICDLFRMSILMQDANKRRQESRGFRERRLDDCYILLIPFGLFGAHHFYLRRVGWGFLYLFTFGCLGVGWLVDFFRLPCLFKQHKEQMKKEQIIRQGGEQGGTGNDNYGTTSDSGNHYNYPPTYPGASGITPGGQTGPPPGTQVYQVPPVYPVLPHGNNPPIYPQKIDGVEGLPPRNLPPPGYDESAMSSFSTIASSNVDGLPSYQDAILENNQNMSISDQLPPTAPSIESK